MTSLLRTVGVAWVILGLAAFIGCSTPGRGGGSGGDNNAANDNAANDNAPDDGGNDNGADDNTANDNGTNEPSPGYLVFEAHGCTECHTTDSNNFSDSTTDDIVDTLLGERPHPGGDFGDLTEEEIDAITDFLLEVILGNDDLDGGGGDDDGDNDNENINDNSDGGDDFGTQATEWFEQIWLDFDRNYSHFATKGVDWDAIHDEYVPRFAAVSGVNAFLDRTADMLAELRDLHVWLFDTDGEVVDVFTKTAARNYPDNYPDQYYPQGVQKLASFPLVHGWLENNIAYISIASFRSELWTGLFPNYEDPLFATYADADAMIFDIRNNNGGDEAIAKTFAGHLTASSYVYGYHRSKNTGLDHDDFGEWVEHALAPSQHEQFLKPVACLIGETNMSSAEWFVLMMLENPNTITLFGDTTRGSSGSPQEFKLDDGIAYWIPSWEAYRADQTTKIEDVGIPPTEGHAIAPEASFTEDDDYVLEAAIEFLSN